MELDEAELTARPPLHRCLGKDTPTLLKLFHEHNERRRALSGIDRAPATVLRYETSLRHTEQFFLHADRKQDIYPEGLNSWAMSII